MASLHLTEAEKDFELAACNSKVAFESMSLAMMVLRRPNKSRHGAAGVYKCKFCRKWHIGSQAPK